MPILWDKEREPPAWTQLKLPGSGPAPRCGHSTTPGGSQVCKSVSAAVYCQFEPYCPVPHMATTFQFAPSGTSWMTKMKFLTPCVCFLALQLLIFGGHGTGGWLTRYDIYHSDCVVLDRGLCAYSKFNYFPYIVHCSVPPLL